LIVPPDGVAAKLSMASKPPAAQRAKAMKMRGLKMPDWEVRFFSCFFIIIFPLYLLKRKRAVKPTTAREKSFRKPRGQMSEANGNASD
jgi:hypothetical protein